MRRTLYLAVSLLLATGACHRGQVAQSTTGGPAILQFANESLYDARVYVVASGAEARYVGSVMPGRTEVIKIPDDITRRGAVSIVARLLATSAQPTTGQVSLMGGEQYAVRLPPDARLLSFLPVP